MYWVPLAVVTGPSFAKEVAAGLPTASDRNPQIDHGVWVPLSLMYPAADIPVIQISLPSRQGPMLQTQVGQALASLRQEGMTLLLVDQMAALALSLADRAYVMEGGRIVAQGTSAEIAADGALAEAYLGGAAAAS